MSLLFKSLFQNFIACFSMTVVRPDYHTFPGHYPSIFKTTSIHTFSKSLIYLRICELREPKGSRTILIYFKIPTY
jgi:hypothetical protein